MRYETTIVPEGFACARPRASSLDERALATRTCRPSQLFSWLYEFPLLPRTAYHIAFVNSALFIPNVSGIYIDVRLCLEKILWRGLRFGDRKLVPFCDWASTKTMLSIENLTPLLFAYRHTQNTILTNTLSWYSSTRCSRTWKHCKDSLLKLILQFYVYI